MIKRLLFLVALALSANINAAVASANDTSYTKHLTAFDWTPISDVEKVMQYENQKHLTKNSIKQAGLASNNYTAAVNLMNNKEYLSAITELKAAMKRYKRAKISDDGMNFINANMALSYVNSGNKEDLATANRFLNLITSKVYSDNKWTYNIAIAHYYSGNPEEAASLLSSVIRKDEFYFQAYITLEAIYRNSGNSDDADRVNYRMNTAEEKLLNKNQKIEKKGEKTKAKREKRKGKSIPKGIKPDVANLKIVKTDNHLQFNKVEKIDERSMTQIQEGISEYNLGVKALENKEYKTAQTHLKNTEKRLKRGKITDDGLNFARGNLAISYLATGEKRGVGQAKRYLKYLTSKLFNTREWIYNIAVANYDFASRSRGSTKEEYLEKSIKLFQKSITKDKLFLPAYENLVYIYKEQGEDKKALKIANTLEKQQQKLMKSFSKEDQLAQGGGAYIFRLKLGIFGEFDTPADLFNEANVITIPISEKHTEYLAGLFYSLDEAVDYQERMIKKGYSNSSIVAYKDGEELEF